MRIAGVMSGTSLDGIDVAIVDIRGRAVRTLGFRSTPYPEAVRLAILEVSNAATTTAAISRLNYRLGELYARAVKAAIERYGPVELIGCHGQTIFHEGGSNTLQIGEAAVIAERTGVPGISNFRARDIAAGGQGAPLVPYVDYMLFRHPRRRRIALNIGGIANITIIPPAARPDDVLAFDTGPGNMVLDALARLFSKGKLNCDRGGRIAQTGRVNRKLLDKLLDDPYYREQYGTEFIARLRETGLGLPDLMATATALTAASIALGIGKADGTPTEVIVSGGGVHNPRLMAQLTAFLPDFALSTSMSYGIDPDAKEAIAFAVLAYRRRRGEAGNLPSATGAKHAVPLGSMTA